jgi:hypothetical protein
VTRLVKIVTGLEAELADGIRSGKPDAAEALLAEDFEMRLSNGPGQPIPRADWLREAIARPGAPATLEQVAVHEIGELAIASFQQRTPAGSGRKTDEVIFVVDVWKRQGETWKLAIRYAGPAGDAGFTATGAGAREPVIPKRY